MIDEKKIEAAAIEASIEDTKKDRVRDNYVIGALADHELGFQEGFKAGVNWFLDNLWHDASEEPKKDKEVLIESCIQKGKGTFVSIIPFDWKFSTKNYNITRWLYIDDLPEGGAE